MRPHWCLCRVCQVDLMCVWGGRLVCGLCMHCVPTLRLCMCILVHLCLGVWVCVCVCARILCHNRGTSNKRVFASISQTAGLSTCCLAIRAHLVLLAYEALGERADLIWITCTLICLPLIRDRLCCRFVQLPEEEIHIGCLGDAPTLWQ